MTVEELVAAYQEKENVYKQQLFLQGEIIKHLKEMNKNYEEKCNYLEQLNEKLEVQLRNLARQFDKKTSRNYDKKK